MWQEFKKFAMKGNVIDLAVGVIIGTAFGAIVTSLVNDLIMPLMGILTGGVDFSERVMLIQGVELKYGAFLQTIIDFFIIAFSVFLFVKFFTRVKRKEEEAPAAEPDKPSKEEELLAEIRDLLKKQNR